MARPGAQIVERPFDMFEMHSESQVDVLQAGEAALGELGLEVSARKRPQIASIQVIINVSPDQSQLLTGSPAA